MQRSEGRKARQRGGGTEAKADSWSREEKVGGAWLETNAMGAAVALTNSPSWEVERDGGWDHTLVGWWEPDAVAIRVGSPALGLSPGSGGDVHCGVWMVDGAGR